MAETKPRVVGSCHGLPGPRRPREKVMLTFMLMVMLTFMLMVMLTFMLMVMLTFMLMVMLTFMLMAMLTFMLMAMLTFWSVYLRGGVPSLTVTEDQVK